MSELASRHREELSWMRVLAGRFVVFDGPDGSGKSTQFRRFAGADPEAAKIEDLIGRRAAARKGKDFKEADRIRDELAGMGVEITDGPQGTTWARKARL